MKTNLSPSRFYLSNIIFYTCLLASPLSATIEQVNQTEGFKPSITSIVNNVDGSLEIDKTENSDQKPSPELTRDEQIVASVNKLNQRYDQLEKKLAEFQSMLSIIISIERKGEYGMTLFLCAVKEGNLNRAKLLEGYGANKEATDKYGDNALHLACYSSGSEEMVKWLLDVCNIGLETEGYYQTTPFLCAAQEGRLGLAKLLKERGANINAIDKYGSNALHAACLRSKSVPMVKWLLDVCKIDKDSKGYAQQTPFLCAAGGGQVEIAKLLKERGAKINAEDVNGNNALHWACYSSGSEEMVTWLLDACEIGIESKGQNQATPFLSAQRKGQLAIAKLLKERGANINTKDEDGDNALHLACFFSGSVDMVTWLLDECKLGLETKGQHQRTPFLCAAQEGQVAVAKLLKERGANLNAKDKDGYNALHFACLYSGSVEMTNWLLDECKIGIEARGQSQETPFLCAAEKGQLAIAKLLRQKGADINAKDEDGDNALHLTCLSGSVEMATWLLDVCKIGIETKGFNQRTPFLCAAQKGQLAIAKRLKEREANLNAKDIDGDNALHKACYFSGSVGMTNWLLDECKLGLETKGYAERTPFLCAAIEGQLAIAKLLKQRGANINAKSKKGHNALYYAKKFSKKEEMISYLESQSGIKTGRRFNFWSSWF